jgi:nicotinamidase-related amidase
MNGDLGVWASEDCALVLIDYQEELLEAIRSETGADLVELHARWLAKTAKAFDMPIVLSTVGVENGIFSPTQPAILAELPDVEPIDAVEQARSSRAPSGPSWRSPRPTGSPSRWRGCCCRPSSVSRCRSWAPGSRWHATSARR